MIPEVRVGDQCNAVCTHMIDPGAMRDREVRRIVSKASKQPAAEGEGGDTEEVSTEVEGVGREGEDKGEKVGDKTGTVGWEEGEGPGRG